MTIALNQICLANPTPQSFLRDIIEPVLCHLDDEIAFSQAAAKLLLGTALKESQQLRHRRQIGGGPALSYFQMEPNTHNDIWTNFLDFRPDLKNKITELLSSPNANKIYELEFNDNYAAGMARVHYFRVPQALPGVNNIQGMATYWKQHYNTPLGAGTVQEYIDHWNRANGNTLAFRSRNEC